MKEPVTKGRAEDLEEGIEYEFRIRAVNKAGQGDPSPPSESIIPKPRKCMYFFITFHKKLTFIDYSIYFFIVAPKIDRRNLKSITIREGEPILYDVKVSGEPAPDVTWSFNNIIISTNSMYQIDNIPYNSKFYHSNPMRSDTGIYKIVASNKYGEDEEEVEVTVICKSNII